MTRFSRHTHARIRMNSPNRGVPTHLVIICIFKTKL
uniref:Uncharacterized protein n=1 Tax=Anguilla anguilla TaxID=7936 RepID=A0A0E9TUG5_ANGAN